MTGWQLALIAVPVWLTLAAVLALGMGRAVRIRDRRAPVVRTVPLDHPDTDDIEAIANATRED